ncbi:MAG: transporter substrate-binding domain-containing protein [Hellea sp.]
MTKFPRALQILGVFIITIWVSFLAVSCKPVTSTSGDEVTSQTVYNRVLETGVIRAAYITYPPAAMKDTVSGEMSGIFVEALEQAASNLGLKVEWTEEVGWGAQIEGLNSDRYDIVGSPVWANPTRGKLTNMSRPLYYSGIGVYVKSGDPKFAGITPADWTPINSEGFRIATIDGETADLIARTQFPKAQRVSLTQLSDISQKFLEVANGQADVLFAEPYFAQQYAKNNPDREFTNLALQKPIRVLGNCYMFKKNETQFKHMLDVAFEDLLNSGYIDELLAKYEGGDTFYKVANPYRAQ